MKKTFIAVCIISFISLLAVPAFAVKPPLITDEANTVGKWRGELEFNFEYAHNSNHGETEKETVLEPVITYGITDNIDFRLAAPYKFIDKEGEEDLSADGISDMSLEMKWRLYEEHGLSFAVRPGITIPSGDHEDELGTGKITYSLFLLGTKEAKPWKFHANLGYVRNEHKDFKGEDEGEEGEHEELRDERNDLLFASVAAEFEVAEHLELVADMGIHTNPDSDSGNPPAYILGGLIYEASEHIDLDFGIKCGLTNSEPDYALLAGVKLKF
jgi:hypothetical protein